MDSSISKCAACSKSGDHLKACTACHLVKYCNRNCQILHRPKHKKECKQRAAEFAQNNDTLDGSNNVTTEGSDGADVDSVFGSIAKVSISEDDKLFQDPPPKKDCSICMLPIPYSTALCGVITLYMPCCGKVLCGGCGIASVEEMKNGNMKRWCAYCRRPIISKKEYDKGYKKRMKLNDAEAFFRQGYAYFSGAFPKDMKKASGLFHRAAELGSPEAHFFIATMCYEGHGVEKDMKKALYHYELAAMGGHEAARHNLGAMEGQKGNAERAYKHYMIAARSGYDDSLKEIGLGYKHGHVTKDEYANTLRAFKDAQDEMKSEQRTKARQR